MIMIVTISLLLLLLVPGFGNLEQINTNLQRGQNSQLYQQRTNKQKQDNIQNKQRRNEWLVHANELYNVVDSKKQNQKQTYSRATSVYGKCKIQTQIDGDKSQLIALIQKNSQKSSNSIDVNTHTGGDPTGQMLNSTIFLKIKLEEQDIIQLLEILSDKNEQLPILFSNSNLTNWCFHQQNISTVQNIKQSLLVQYRVYDNRLSIYFTSRPRLHATGEQQDEETIRFDNNGALYYNKNEEISNYCAWILLGVSTFAIIVELAVIVIYIRRSKKSENRSSIHDSQILSRHSGISNGSNQSKRDNIYQRMG